MSKYKLVPQPKESWEDNPCWDCVFGKEDGECHAPKEIIDLDEDCGYIWGNIYIEENENEDQII